MYNDLKSVLKAYKDGNKGIMTFKRGDWKIAEGGYDLWFEIYYKDIPKIQCIAGKLEVGNEEDINVEKVLGTIKQILNYVK